MYRPPLPVLAALLVAGLLLAGCAAGPAATTPAPVELGLQASGHMIQLEPGQKLVITLESNPSTGFDWHVVKYADTLLALEEDAYVPPPNARIGQGGTHRFVFTALERGSSVLELAYYRPWEGSEKAEDWFQQIVEIR